ncbi:MAG TPA: UDP-N-acetylmuramoyl-L-alanyl-D-glutamate--2,6-diaminopimelate ligase [Demequinaceae bacterium]
MAVRPTHVDPVPASKVASRAGARLDPPDANVGLTGATVDSRGVLPGDLFGAIPGFSTHGATFAAAAVAAGAAAVLTDTQGAALASPTGVPVIVSDDPRRALGLASAAIYGDPSRALTLIGVTGTNGKTTTAYFIDAALRRVHAKTGLLGTVEMRIGGESLPAVRTTIEAPAFQAILARMLEVGVGAATMEVSSHALELGRVAGSHFAVAAFSNLQWDHLDFHATMEDYFRAKARLFTPELAERGVVCVDDEWGVRLAKEATVPVVRVATRPEAGAAEWTVADTRLAADGVGTDFALVGPAGERIEASSPLPAHINVSNAALAIIVAIEAGVPVADAVAGVASTPGVPGRMQRVLERDAETPLAIVDYAHTPDALERALEGARTVTPGRLISVFGAGGDRDTGKRPQFGKVAGALADVVIVTDDNPRSEEPGAIREGILAGLRRERPSMRDVHEVAPREEAIRFALALAAPGDTILLSGKGHEDYQEVAGVKHHFSDQEELLKALAESGRS